MLSINRLSKFYPPHKCALNKITLEVGEGVLGILGPNGAGKSSLMEILAANLDFEQGDVMIDGRISLKRSPRKWRMQLGSLPQSFDFPTHTTGREMLEESLLLLGHSPRRLRTRIDDMLHRVNLSDAAHRSAAEYSRGMKQRLGLAMALMHRPRLLLLDEPTAGLDPVERVVFRDLLAEYSSDCIVLLSTHIVTDIERLCSRVAVLHQGSLLEVSSPAAIAQRAKGMVWEMPVPVGDVDKTAAEHRVISIRAEAGRALMRILAECPPSSEAQPATATLEDGYLMQIGSVVR
jgi:ABC-type multidrug transport system ATPase subunit